MNKVIILDGNDLRAHKEFSMNLPLNSEDYKKLKGRIPYVPIAGEPFDEINTIYPLRIPNNPTVFPLNEKEDIFSMLYICNKEGVSVIGDTEMKDLYIKNPGQYVYGVGTRSEKSKNGKTYQNMKLRGWLLVKIKNTMNSTNKTTKK